MDFLGLLLLLVLLDVFSFRCEKEDDCCRSDGDSDLSFKSDDDCCRFRSDGGACACACACVSLITTAGGTFRPLESKDRGDKEFLPLLFLSLSFFVTTK